MNLMYTHNDLDGIGCALIGKLLNFDQIYYCSYTMSSSQNYVDTINKTMSEIPSSEIDVVYLTDISLVQSVFDKFKDSLTRARHVVWIDHHDSSLALAESKPKEFNTIKVSTDCSATLRFYRSYKNAYPELQEYEVLFEAINAFDTWNFKLSTIAKDLERVYNYACFQDPTTRYVKFRKKLDHFTNCLLNDPPMVDIVGEYPEWMKSCLNLYHRDVDPKVNTTIENGLNIDGRVCVVNARDEDDVPTYELSWYIDEKHPEVDYVIYNIKKTRDNTSYVSLRFSSTDHDEVPDKDLSKIAEEFGGGGHIKASAFIMGTDEAESAVRKIGELLKVK